ncbi:hypothetical protein OCU04_000805 [Sclerotinia nivalis]|uniref:Probable beta-glucosidase btgE n=1 Tax=Sclerotinia nivalis TaxID=352851 RepID=A0A9X0AWU7_9HELO|nr:hypothetical protein OCU04_000805 [Sclerotinia nivalis]
MKAGVIAVAAALAGSVTARDLGRRHGHQDFHGRGLLATGASSSESCGCTTVWSTVTGQPQLYFPPAPTAGSSASGSVPSGPAGSVPSGPAGTVDACVSQCNASYNSCRSAPDANRASCASSYASCLGYSPYDNNGSLVTPTACSSPVASSTTVAPTTTADACVSQCNVSYNSCRSAPDANRASCASSYASCLGYSPYDNNGSLVTPTACSSPVASSTTAAPTTSGPAGSVPSGPAGSVPAGSIPSSPAGSSPGGSVPGGSTPASSAPAGSVPGGSTPASSIPGAPAPPSSAPGGSVPGGSTPASSAPAGSVPSNPAGSPPAGSSPGAPGPASSAPAGSPPAGSVPSSPAGSSPGGSTPGGSTPGSSAPGASQGVSTAPNLPASTAPPAVPTPFATTAATPGVYTIPATTVTLTESTTVCGATSTGLPSAGTYTVGGVTTVVTTETTIVCPYAAVTTTDGVVTSTILTTTYVCPVAGTYTINPLTTTVTEPAVWVYPTPASFAPGTYTQPEVVTTITETNVVVFCPYSSSAYTIVDATLPASTYAQATTAPAPVSTSVAIPVVTPSSSSVYVAPSSSAVSVVPSSVNVASSVASSVASPSASSSSSSSGNGGSVGSSGNQWAMTYSPYQDSGACKTAEQVSTDVALIASKGFKAIRMYSTDCSGLENIGSAAKTAGIKLIIGIFISETGCSGAASQVTDLIAWGQWSLVELIVVGNEAIFNGYATATELAAFISSSSSSFKSSGYSGQVTTTEPLNIWQEYTSTLCAVVDITGANLHPFFNAQTTAENAGKFALSQLELAESICPGLSAVNLECGWPSAGSCNGLACPGTSEQSIAIASIVELCGGRTTIFSYTDDYWKAPGAFNAEQHWGSIHLF